jgi:hypothetical protein
MHYVVASSEPNSYEIMLALMEKWEYSDNPSDESDKFLMSVIRTKNLSESQKTGRIKKLLEYGVYADEYMEQGGYSLYVKDTTRWTPLYAAIERRYAEICDLLLQKIVKNGGSPTHPNALLATNKYYNIYPYCVHSRSCYKTENSRSIDDKIYNILNRYGFITYGGKYAKEDYEFNPFK